MQELGVGGAERVAISLASSLEAGSAAIAAAPGALADDYPGRIYPLPLIARRIGRVPLAARRLRQAISDFQPDFVHAHNPAMALITALARRGARRPPAAVTVHGMPDGDYPAATRILRLARLPVVACGPGVARALADHGLPPVATVINAVSPPPPAADRAAICRELSVDPERRLVVAVGRLVEQKNHAMALAMLPALPDAHLVVVGDGPLAVALKRRATALGVADRVTLAGVRSDARQIMGAADVVVLPSRWEGLPLVALEAMAAGVPLVATAVTGIRELISDGRTGLLVEPDDVAGMAEAVRRVLGEPDLAKSTANAAAEVARQHSPAAMAAGYRRVYEQVSQCHR